MPRPDRLWLVLIAGVLAISVGGCKSHSKAKLGPSMAPVYSVRDPDNVRRQVRWQDLLSLAARDLQVGNLDAAERKVREAQKLAPDAPDGVVLLMLFSFLGGWAGATVAAGCRAPSAAATCMPRGDPRPVQASQPAAAA